MSIINDALKKTQMHLLGPKKDRKKQDDQAPKEEPVMTNVYEKMYKDKEIKTNATGTRQANRDEHLSSQPPALDKVKYTLKIVFAIIFLIGSLYVCFTVLSRNDKIDNLIRSAKTKRGSSPNRIVIPPPAKKRVYKPGDLILNGTSLIDGNKVALINDEIYEIGDMINDKKVISIEPNEVELQDDTDIITIKVR